MNCTKCFLKMLTHISVLSVYWQIDVRDIRDKRLLRQLTQMEEL